MGETSATRLLPIIVAQKGVLLRRPIDLLMALTKRSPMRARFHMFLSRRLTGLSVLCRNGTVVSHVKR